MSERSGFSRISMSSIGDSDSTSLCFVTPDSCSCSATIDDFFLETSMSESEKRRMCIGRMSFRKLQLYLNCSLMTSMASECWRLASSLMASEVLVVWASSRDWRSCRKHNGTRHTRTLLAEPCLRTKKLYFNWFQVKTLELTIMLEALLTDHCEAIGRSIAD